MLLPGRLMRISSSTTALSKKQSYFLSQGKLHKKKKKDRNRKCTWFSSNMSDLVHNIISGFKNIVTFGAAEAASDQSNDACCGGKSDDQSACCSSDSTAKETAGSGCCKGNESASACACSQTTGPVEIDHIKIFYSTLTGTARKFAEQLQTELQAAQPKVNIQNISVIDIVDYDNDDFLTESAICIFILSSYNVEGPLDW